ncbi:hypothetical protein N8590_00210 [bacterium]|jgi:hypothetical protein|nr:hypothetical protein [bacterium]
MQLEIPSPEPAVDSAQTKTDALTDGNTASDQGIENNFLRENLVVSGWGLLGTVLVAVFFIYCSYLPIYHTDIWGHVSYGQSMIETGKLPVEDPYVELAAGVEMINNAWLSQLLFGWLVNQSGPQGIGDGYAVICLATFLAFAATFSVSTGNRMLGFCLAVCTWLMITFRLAIVRPELLGELCFALVLLQIAIADRVRRKSENKNLTYPIWMWFSLPLTFMLWANLHGAYIVGFAVLGAAVLGSLGTAIFKHRSVSGVWTDKQLRADVMLVQLSLLAACLNPYGIDLLLQTALFPTHPNLKTVLEWTPLEIISLEGIPMATSWLFAAFFIRHSKVRFPIRDVILLLVLSLAVCLRVRMIAWYSPVYFFVMAPHVADVFRQVSQIQFVAKLQSVFGFMSRPTFHIALVTGFVCYLAFAFTPISRHAMGGTVRPLDQIVSKQTPIGITNYFKEHPQEGLIYAPQWWGDWINWELDGDVKVFVSTNSIHLVPPEVWNHYMTISRGRPGSQALLTRYRINTMVVSKDLQPGLVKMFEGNKDWKATFSDDISVIFERTTSSATTKVAAH